MSDASLLDVLYDFHAELAALIPPPRTLYSVSDYRGMLQSLLPPGAIWQAAPGSLQLGVLSAWAEEFTRIDGRAADLVAESRPETTATLLEEWESEFGLPEPCDTRTELSTEARVARLVAKFYYRAITGPQKWHALAAGYGATVALSVGYPSYAGVLRAGRALTGRQGRHIWRVRILTPGVVVTRFVTGRSRAGHLLGAWPRSPLECALRQRNPAHLYLVVAYTED